MEGLNLEGWKVTLSKGQLKASRLRTAAENEDVASTFVNDAGTLTPGQEHLSDRDAEEIISDMKDFWNVWLRFCVVCKGTGLVFSKWSPEPA